MIVKHFKDALEIDKNIYKKYNLFDMAYFDIETTGFDKENDQIILISIGHFCNKDIFVITQYFSEAPEDEVHILYEFNKKIKNYKVWCTYNGGAFDIPFIKKKMSDNNIKFNSQKKHNDLYRMIRPFYRSLGMERCNLKSVERRIGIQRQDKIDGGISVKLYDKYMQSRDEKIRDIIMLHNYEDVLNLPKIYKLIYEIDEDDSIRRDNAITMKQLAYLKALIKKDDITLDFNIEKISKKEASKLIESILRNVTDGEELREIIKH